MARDPVELVRQWFAEQLKDWPGEAFSLLAEDVVLCPSSGQVYVGHEGYAHWYEAQVKTYEQSAFEDASFEALENGWVLVAGAVASRLRSGETERQPGAWLVRVRDDLISAVLYYRTAEEGRNALKSGPSRGPSHDA